MPSRLQLSPATLRTCGVSLLAALVALLMAGCERAAPQSAGTAPTSAAGKLDPKDPDFQKRVQARLAEMEREEAIREEAPWFGMTGLPEEQERELPRYLRREFGQLLSQPGALRAHDLEYLGLFAQEGDTVHYWRIHAGSPGQQFAYVVVAPAERQAMGWGSRVPPR